MHWPGMWSQIGHCTMVPGQNETHPSASHQAT